jgi:signal transduction histidine kinase
VPLPAVQSTEVSAVEPEPDGHEVAKLRARVAELERELAVQRAEPKHHAEFRDVLYEAVIYGLARTLSLYDPQSVRLLVREMGRRIREYLEELGYHVGGGETLNEVVEQTVAFFVSNGFVDLELVSWDNDVIRARWHRLLGLRAYQRIVAAGGETFISCPLNAILHDSLEPFGKELSVLRKEFDLEASLVESWEAIVDVPVGASSGLSLEAERLLELEREQSRQLRIRDDFIRLASHELATPLTSAKLALGRLEKTDLSEDASRSVAIVARQVRRLEHLVSEMLDTTQLQIGRMKLTRASVDVVQLTNGALESLRSGLRRDLAEVRLDGEESVVGSWDGARLEQVLVNVVGNAIKYGGGRPIQIDVTTLGEQAHIRIRDEGIGIAPEVMKRLFAPFERGASARHYGGLGLGLFIARRIVQMHGGRIEVDSEPDKGTTVTIVLPLESAGEQGMLVEVPKSVV